jgi:hypothetical protein
VGRERVIGRMQAVMWNKRSTSDLPDLLLKEKNNGN